MILSQKLIRRKIETAMIPDEKVHGLGTQQESCKKNMLVPTILGQGHGGTQASPGRRFSSNSNI